MIVLSAKKKTIQAKKGARKKLGGVKSELGPMRRDILVKT